ncbi:MAG: efflux RND transporter permease subunit, partial [Pseudomonadota bacterium]
DFTLRARTLTVGLAVLAAMAAGASYFTLTDELLPREDRGVILVSMQGPDGVGLDYMDRMAAQAEAILAPHQDSGAIENIMSIVGRWDPNRVFIIAPMAPWSDRAISQADVARAIRRPLADIAGSTARVRQPNSLGLRRSGGRLEFALVGDDYAVLAAAANAFLSELEARPLGIDDAEVEFQQTQPQLTLEIDRERAEDLGVAVDAVALTLRAMVDGLDVLDLTVDDRSIPVLIESAAGAVDDPGDLDNLFVRASDGALAPLSAFATLTEAGVAAELDRVAQRRAVEIDAGLAEGVALRDAMTAVQAVAGETLPAGVSIRFINEAAALDETANDVVLTFMIAILIVFLVLAAQFESLLSALVILLTVPFGLAAAVFALNVTDTSLNIYSQIGLVMLVGLMAKNGILVVEFADQLRDRGASVPDAIRQAASIRLRPIMMTIASTVLGALPLVLASGAGAEARAAIGWVVVGGLGAATVFTLFLIPALYSLLALLAGARAHAGVRLDRELRAAQAAPA